VHPATGILLRVMDKIQRIKSFIEKNKLEVQGESFEDACDDIINYMVLIKGYIKDNQQDQCKTHQLSLSQPQPRKKKTSTTRSQYRLDGAIQTKVANPASK
jgi:hypothetical protein